MAGRCVQAQADRGGPAPDAPEIWMAGLRASRWPWALALPVDLLAHREATDSNSVWELPAPSWRQRADESQQRQASLRQALEKSRVAWPQEWLRAASRQQELAVLPEQQLDARVAWPPWQRLGLAQVKSLRAPRVERPPALELLEAEQPPQV